MCACLWVGVSVWVQVVFLDKCVTVVQYDVLRSVCFYLYETVTEMHRRTVFTAYVAIESLLIDLVFSKINDK